MTTKKPQPDLVIRMVGSGVRPWAVPMRSLTRTLQAVQSLIDSTTQSIEALDEEPVEEPEESQEGEKPQDERALYLLDVVAKSATYPVGTHDRARAIRVLQDTGEAIRNPEGEAWSAEMLYSIRSLSEVAQSLGCKIEFRRPGEQRLRPLVDPVDTVNPFGPGGLQIGRERVPLVGLPPGLIGGPRCSGRDSWGHCTLERSWPRRGRPVRVNHYRLFCREQDERQLSNGLRRGHHQRIAVTPPFSRSASNSATTLRWHSSCDRS